MNFAPVLIVLVTFAGLVVFGIPFFAILTSHREKMRQIELEAKAGISEGDPSELESLRTQVKDLKEIVHQQTIDMDNMNRVMRSLNESGTETQLPRIDQR